MRDFKREKEIYPRIFDDDFKFIKEKQYDKIMDNLATDEERYLIVLEILEYKKIYWEKTKSIDKISIATIQYFPSKTTYALKEIRHKWMKLSENPDIEPSELFKDFTV